MSMLICSTMIYSVSITTSNGTAEADADIFVLKVNKGLVFRLEVEFPPGCCGLLHCQIFDGSYQIYPASRDDSFHSDARVIGFDDCYLKMSAPFEFRIKTWNLDETWNHSIQVRVGMASSEAFMSRYMPSISWEKFQEVLARTVVEQEVEKARVIEEFAKDFKG